MVKVVNGFITGLVIGTLVSMGFISIIVVLTIFFGGGMNGYPTKEEWKAGLRRK